MSNSLSGSPEVDLIQSSLNNAQARIQLFRIAFGQKSQGTLGAAELQSICSAYYANSRNRIHWITDHTVERARAQLALLMVMCVESALPRGGKISVDAPPDRLAVSGAGEKTNVTGEGWDFLRSPDGAAALPAGLVHFSLLSVLAEAAGSVPVFETTGTGLTLSL